MNDTDDGIAGEDDDYTEDDIYGMDDDKTDHHVYGKELIMLFMTHDFISFLRGVRCRVGQDGL